MRFIPTRIHAVLDYLTGALLVVAPWLFGFAANAAATWVAIIFGVGLIAYSLFTDYELAASRQIPMSVHLALDAASGAFLLVSPWLLGFAPVITWPHVVIGLLEIGAALTTQRTPSDERLPAAGAT
jgi:hypothetical protein